MLALCKEIVVFLVIAKVLESFQIGKKYGKFVRLIISLIVLLKMIVPVITFFNGDFELSSQMSNIEKELFYLEQPVREIEPVKEIELSQIKIDLGERQ